MARYYDRNTRRFLRFGRALDTWGIHRQLWGSGVTTHRDAANHVNVLIEERIRSAFPGGPATVLDLGCGVGGTMFHLARAFPGAELVGVTISSRQADLGQQLARRAHLTDRCRFEVADFESMDLGVSASVALAVESFVHAASAERFFGTAAAHLGDGGLLLVADDFLAREDASLCARKRRLVADVREGWHAPGICAVEDFVAAALAMGIELEAEADLTGLIRLGRLRDRAIQVVRPLLRLRGLGRFALVQNLVGGGALHEALRAGVMEYRMLAMRKGRGLAGGSQGHAP